MSLNWPLVSQPSEAYLRVTQVEQKSYQILSESHDMELNKGI